MKVKDCPDKLKVPELPKGYYFHIWYSVDRYSRPVLVISLMRKRRFWLDKPVASEAEYRRPITNERILKENIEAKMLTLSRTAAAEEEFYKYCGRHP